MSDSSGSAATGGMGCLGVLGVVFVALKLAQLGTIANWSWWLVLSPWIAQEFIVGGLCLILIVAALAKR